MALKFFDTLHFVKSEEFMSFVMNLNLYDYLANIW